MDGGDDGATRTCEMFQGFDEVEGAGGVQSRRRFIEEQDTRVPEHLNPDADSPAFSPRTPALFKSVANSCMRAFLQTEFEDNLFHQLATLLRSDGRWEAKRRGVEQGFADSKGREQHIGLCNIGACHCENVWGSIVSCASGDGEVLSSHAMSKNIEEGRLSEEEVKREIGSLERSGSLPFHSRYPR